ncbi:class I SAM-dependent methyltransferase [Paradesulfitobacterium ferrireducens]|uniref:class I SAM-dependent methyltransferase n=1 Tax=Paradesulfitobacterium ferrireducens TaxID=2816476 RepID=UPI001A8FAEFD|nr:class I SAM-dependent methyltransferase [Paradesulfitobacterium ferrireducens]
MIERIQRIQDIQGLLRLLLKQFIAERDVVLDATAGRGRDTVFLAECVGAAGKVYALDIQEEAIRETGQLLEIYGLKDRVMLYLLDHAALDQVVQDKLAAAVFNLGYLPGSDHQITTEPASTLAAIRAVLKRLKPGGVLALTLYRGHPGAGAEAAAVETLLQSLPPKEYSVLAGNYLNQKKEAPSWVLVQKIGED